MHNTGYFRTGDVVELHWAIGNVRLIRQAMYVVKDTPEETALFITPGAECLVPAQLWTPAGKGAWDRWDAQTNGVTEYRTHPWQWTNALMLVRPYEPYSVMHYWDAATGRFNCYYINFQLPLVRTATGFETFDLELDYVVPVDGAPEWKDREEYERGVSLGCITPEWVGMIDASLPDLMRRIQAREYPFDGSWLGYKPDPAWPTLTLKQA